MKIQFLNHLGISKKNRALLDGVNDIIEDYASQGYVLTLRQLYYQLVIKNTVRNHQNEYEKLSSLLTKGRLTGVVDWDAIEDRTRAPKLTYFNASPDQALVDVANTYRLDRQQGQGKHVELWVEKDALSNVLSRKTEHYHVRLMVNRGYSSTTAMFDSYERFRYALSKGDKVHILYLGDHDPSGRDMLRDIQERMIRMLANQPGSISNFVDDSEDIDVDELMRKHEEAIEKFEFDSERDYKGMTYDYSRSVLAYVLENFELRHIALTTEQVRTYNPPPNPAKLSDPRAVWYINEFGETCWEVDALNPTVLHSVIDKEILSIIDIDKFNQVLEQEQKDIAFLKRVPVNLTNKIKIDELVKELDIDSIQERIVKYRTKKSKEQYGNFLQQKLREIKALANEG